MSDNNSVVIDLSNYKDRMGSRVPEGRYRVVVEDAERDTSQAGNTMINVFLRVIEPAAYADSTLVDRLTLTEKALFRVVGFMQGIGLPTPRKRLQVNFRQFVGKVVDIDVEDGDPFNGRVKSEVRGYLKVENPGQFAAEAQDLDDIDTGSSGLDEFRPAPNGAAKPNDEAAALAERVRAAAQSDDASELGDNETIDLDSLRL